MEDGKSRLKAYPTQPATWQSNVSVAAPLRHIMMNFRCPRLTLPLAAEHRWRCSQQPTNPAPGTRHQPAPARAQGSTNYREVRV